MTYEEKLADFRERSRQWHPLYRIYRAMKRRCSGRNRDGWKHYGGRGILVCPEWRPRGAFQVFKEWALSNGWKPGLQIDRIDNDGNYEPGNCMFVTGRENSRKRSSSKLVMADARKIRWLSVFGIPQREIARQHGVSQPQISLIVLGKQWKEGA